MKDFEKLVIDANVWKKKSEKGEVCGIFACKAKPIIFCEHCGNWYCEGHKFVLSLPGHSIDNVNN